MPKIIELTVEIDVQKVSCPGVWLCQSGRVSLIVFALGTSYQTCLLPSVFPLMFKDVLYFRKQFQKTCALNNICCLLKDETIYCELVQWSEDCNSGKCLMLAQYLGALNDVLFPPNMCSSDGVDLLMRRSKGFPGILSPKIEIATKVRLDELWNAKTNIMMKGTRCQCASTWDPDGGRQKAVCHTPMYHRVKCNSHIRPLPTARGRSRSRSWESRSCCSVEPTEANVVYSCPKPDKRSRFHASPSPHRSPARHLTGKPYNIYYAETASATPWQVNSANNDVHEHEDDIGTMTSDQYTSEQVNDMSPSEERLQKLLIESRYVDEHRFSCPTKSRRDHRSTPTKPCVCDICRRYYELFHNYSDAR